MIKITPSDQRHYVDHGWLETRWHFSFGDYYDEANQNWGVLRVFNDDIIKPGGGFDFHPHRDMEIVTIVLTGELEHRDNLGNRGIIKPGEVQAMTAGKGIYHSEQNPSSREPLHLLQLWILPRNTGNVPHWEQRHFRRGDRMGKLMPVVSGGDLPDTLRIDQDAQIYLSSLPEGFRATHSIRPGRKGYLFVIAGSVKLNGQPMQEGDQARAAEETRLELAADQPTELILLDLPELKAN
ncbi:MAG: pirin family protein [Tepidisphaeraceae bacterium]|jgi:redox-sensitive bicupin YhaK (pirin superfamily)